MTHEQYFYVAKALRRAQGAVKSTAPSGVGKDDGSFDGLVDEPKPEPKAKSTSRPVSPAPTAKEEPKAEPATSPAADAAKAASILRLGQALERSGKTAGALDYYRRVTKEYPDTPQAKTAADRLKALGEP